MKHISITGDLGSGKSCVAKLLCHTTSYEYFSTGSLQRKLAAEKGMNTLELNYFSEQTNDVDDYIDAFLKKIEADQDSPVRYVLDSRLAWHFVPSSFKVFLTVQPDVAAQRVVADKERSGEPSTSEAEETKRNLLERQAVESRRFKKLYNITYRDLSNYDLVIDTSDKTPEEVAALILAKAVYNLSDLDIEQVRQKGISLPQVMEQLQRFEKGFPYLSLIASASVDKNGGIVRFDSEEEESLLKDWNDYLGQSKGKVLKFVPASGAASRMFKDLFAFLEADYDQPRTQFEKVFFSHCHCFAFADELNQVCLRNQAKSLAELLEEGSYKVVAENLLTDKGLNYGALPKGLLSFHLYEKGARKALAEHLIEGALYTADATGNVYLHFTVSPEHRSLFEQECARVQTTIETHFGMHFHISFSEQKSSTDTIAADKDNQAFRDHGKLLFRPGGHGALIENLNELDADIVFIKNIDNVVPDHLKDSSVYYKKLLAGYLVSLQRQIFDYLKLLESGKYTHAQLIEIVRFVQQKLFTRHSGLKQMEDAELVIYLRSKLNRPIRVCGMVRNEGEPGGGPFLVQNRDGSTSLQILESSQIDMNNENDVALFRQGTHFNPVDLVCAIKNVRGEVFDLRKYVDPDTGFISSKSKNGQELKALELPGLWNGAMSDWNTVFVEVPIATFNPVKTVNDLLREQHQSPNQPTYTNYHA